MLPAMSSKRTRKQRETRSHFNIAQQAIVKQLPAGSKRKRKSNGGASRQTKKLRAVQGSEGAGTSSQEAPSATASTISTASSGPQRKPRTPVSSILIYWMYQSINLALRKAIHANLLILQRDTRQPDLHDNQTVHFPSFKYGDRLFQCTHGPHQYARITRLANHSTHALKSSLRSKCPQAAKLLDILEYKSKHDITPFPIEILVAKGQKPLSDLPYDLDKVVTELIRKE